MSTGTPRAVGLRKSEDGRVADILLLLLVRREAGGRSVGGFLAELVLAGHA